MATKTPEVKAAATALKALQNKAKKLKIDFAGLPVEELQILISAAEAAATAQKEKTGDVGAAPEVAGSSVTSAPVSDRVDVQEAQAKADAANEPSPVTPAGDTVIQSVVTKNKEKHNLVLTPKGEVKIKTVHGVVLHEFNASDKQQENISEGKRHMENLSRF